jgi:hypothetical protein
MRRVLKPAGRLLAVDFGVDPSGHRGLLGHLHRHGGLSARNLVELVMRAGYEVVQSGPVRLRPAVRHREADELACSSSGHLDG